MHFLCVILVLAISFLSADAAVCEERSSSGRTFMLAVMDTAYNNYVTAINVNIAADGDGHVNITAPSIHLNRRYHLKDGVTTVALNKSIITTINGTGRTGILLESNIDVTVRVVLDGTGGAVQEGYLALPTPPVGPSSYVLASWMPFGSYPSEFLIVCATDNTTVTITDFTRQQVSSQSIILNKFDTYQNQFKNLDPSGTFIYASGPVSVWSGSQCSEVLFLSCQSLVEQLVSVSSWGESYVTPALHSKHWNVIRVYTANYTATLTLSNFTTTRTLNISSFDYTTIVYQDEPLSIQSDRPVQVMQYSTGTSDGHIGDEFMMTIPDVNSFLSEYKMKPVTIYTHDVHQPVYLSITIDQTHETGLLLNGLSIRNISQHDVAVTPHGNYSVITTRLTADMEYVLRHRTPGVTFGALLFGYPDYAIGYGYGLGMKLRVEGCTTQVPSTTTPVPGTTTSLLPTSQTETTPVPSTTTPVPDTTISLLPTSQTETTPVPLTTTPVPDTTTSILPTSHTDTTPVPPTTASVTDTTTSILPTSHTETTLVPPTTASVTDTTTSLLPTSHTETTPVPPTTASVTDTTTSLLPTSHTETIRPGLGLTCMACEDMTHVELCNIVKRCDEMEVCFLEKYPVSGGVTRFRSGCVKPSECQVGTSQSADQFLDSCKMCCSENYCNSKGCGELGLPAIGSRGLPTIGSRGPLCYSCSYVTSVEECTTVELCYPGQVCRISKFKWGGQLVHYQLECGSDHMCKTNPSHVYRSSVPVCHNCCDSDFCNTSCNKTAHPGASLIG